MKPIFRGFVEDESGSDFAFYNNKWHCGKWVVGYYVCLNEHEHRIYTGYAEIDCGKYYPDWYKIAAETVGQIAHKTHRQDLGDTEFFEGDIVEVDRGEGGIWQFTIVDSCQLPKEMFGSSVKHRKVIGNIFSKNTKGEGEA